MVRSAWCDDHRVLAKQTNNDEFKLNILETLSSRKKTTSGDCGLLTGNAGPPSRRPWAVSHTKLWLEDLQAIWREPAHQSRSQTDGVYLIMIFCHLWNSLTANNELFLNIRNESSKCFIDRYSVIIIIIILIRRTTRCHHGILLRTIILILMRKVYCQRQRKRKRLI